MSPSSLTSALSLRSATSAEHLDHIHGQSSASFLQTPAWALVKPEWRNESVVWERDGRVVGSALVLYRQLPRLKRYLAYLPEGPVIDWETDDLAGWLAPLAAHLKKQGAFGVRIGPAVVTRRWSAAQVKEGIADDAVRRLDDVPPLERDQVGARVVSQLHELGWRPQAVEGGFAAGQPQYNFHLPLEGRTEDDVLKGMNQQWRRNIKKAAKEGVVVTRGAGSADLKAFHDLYVHTAERDGFTPRPLGYFTTMFDALSAQDTDPDPGSSPVEIVVHLAHHEADLVAATISIRVGTHAWYAYGASSTEKRDVRGSNAIQWAMISDALAAGCTVYDMRGITDTLDSDDSHVGLIQFKVGTGGEAVEYAGEWDLPLNKALYAAFAMYMKRRSS